MTTGCRTGYLGVLPVARAASGAHSNPHANPVSTGRTPDMEEPQNDHDEIIRQQLDELRMIREQQAELIEFLRSLVASIPFLRMRKTG